MGQILGVRWAGLVVCFAASTAWAAPRSSNPAFLGIRMQDLGNGGPCMVQGVTHDSPAHAAGLRAGDIVMVIDGTPTGSCNALLNEITAHIPGDTVQIKVQRHSALVVVDVQLTTRDALLHKVIGKPMAETSFVGVEDDTVYDLSALHGRMAIVGLYNPACTDCSTLFTKFLDWSRAHARKGDPQALVLAVTPRDPSRDPRVLQGLLDVPLATGEFTTSDDDSDSSPFGRELLLADHDRLGVIVIDGRGIVQYLGPIAPNSEDTEAVLDELFAAADQASRRSK
jgi:membrane-associated protease RseP (regulator of RpoE activity)